MQIATEWLETESQERAYRKPLFNVVPSLTLRPNLSPKWGSQTHTQDQLRDEYSRRYRQAVCCTGCHYEPSNIAFCRIQGVYPPTVRGAWLD